MKLLSSIVQTILLTGMLFLSVQVVAKAHLNQKAKSDYAELNSVKYGLFSIDAWKEKLSAIINSEVEEFTISPETEKEMRKHVAVVLNKMIDQAAAKIEKANGKTTGGKFKQMFIDMFVDVKDIKKGIPEYTDAVMKEFKKPKTQKQIKALVGNQVEEISAKTADAGDLGRLKGIVAELGEKDVEGARKHLDDTISKRKNVIVLESGGLIALGIALFGLFFFGKARSPSQFIILVLALLTLLAAGVATPMIDMEAKISELKFTLTGHEVLFQNQVLYFQSKSIIDVFLLMIGDDQLPMKAVAILVVTFSIVFPCVKLLSTIGYYFDFKGAKENAFVQFFVHKSGKWSMADVMVVAIFMAFIGFNGVISSQLKELNFPDSGVDIIATNGTSLQPGYYVFVTFVMISMLLTGLLKKGESAPLRRGA